MGRTLTIAALGAALALTYPSPLHAASIDDVPQTGAQTTSQQAPVGEKVAAKSPTNDDKPLFPTEFKPVQPGAAVNKPASKAVDTSGSGLLSSTAVPLVIVLGVILVASAVFKRAVKSGGSLASSMGAGGRAPAGLLEVLGRYPVARGQTLVLLKLDQRVLLLSQTSPSRGHAGGFQTLSEITDPGDVASILMKVSETEGTGPAAKFNAMLSEADGRHEPLPKAKGLGRLASLVNGGRQPVSWVEPEPPAPTQVETPEIPAPTMRFTGVDSLRSRLAAIKQGGEA